jgi:hypothetical protein
MEKQNKKAKATKIKEVKTIENVEVNELKTELIPVEVLDLDDKKEFKIILLPISGMVKKETEKEVGGNIAKVLIKKGFARLKQ